MKKLVLFFAAAIFAVTFAACGNKAAKTNEDAEPVVTEEPAAPADEVPAAEMPAEEAPAAE